jgi:hypothetical protein
MGVGTDAGLVPDPENIVTGFHDEFEAMRRLAGRTGPAGETAGPSEIPEISLPLRK